MSRLYPLESWIASDEAHLTTDMIEHARRLSMFTLRTVGKVWREQPNGEWWLIDVIDGSRGRTLPTN